MEMEGEDMEDVLDVSDTCKCKCKCKVTKDSLDRIWVEMGRQELIQKLHLMAQAWRNPLKEPLANDGNFNSASS